MERDQLKQLMILVEQAEQLDEIDFKKALATAALAGTLATGAQDAEAQDYVPEPHKPAFVQQAYSVQKQTLEKEVHKPGIKQVADALKVKSYHSNEINHQKLTFLWSIDDLERQFERNVFNKYGNAVNQGHWGTYTEIAQVNGKPILFVSQVATNNDGEVIEHSVTINSQGKTIATAKDINPGWKSLVGKQIK